MSIKNRFLEFWYFHIANPKVREGEAGGFKWVFRRFTFDVKTVSGNFKARFTAGEHPYAYLLAGTGDENIHGFAATLYQVGKLLTTDQGFCNDVQRAIIKYEKRLEKKAAGEVVEDEIQEKVAMEEVKAVQEYVDAPKKEKRKMERESNGRFKKAIKDEA